MSYQQPIAGVDEDRLPAATEGTGWTLLRYGWPALLIFLGLAWGMIFLSVGAEAGGDAAAYGLSSEALAQGRWIVVLGHVFLPSSLMMGTVLCLATFIAGATAPALRDPDWMGGWRLPAVFAAAVAAADCVHLLTARTPLLLGPWPAILAVIVWLTLAGRHPRTDRTNAAAAEPASVEAGLQSALEISIGLVFLMSELRDVDHGWRIETPGWLSAVVIPAGGLLAYGATRLGGKIGRRLCRIVFVALWLAVIVGWIVRSGPLVREIEASALTLPWATWMAALAVGLAAGLTEAWSTRARRQG